MLIRGVTKEVTGLVVLPTWWRIHRRVRHTILISDIFPWCVPSDTPLLQLLSFPELLLYLTFDGLVTARPQRWASNKKRTPSSTPNLELLQRGHLTCSRAVMSCNTIGANHVTFKSDRLAQEVREAEERVHAEVKGEDDVRLLRPQGHRSPRNCSVGYHREPTLLQGMSTSTSSTLLQILGRLITGARRIKRDRWETKSWMLDHDQLAGACCHQCQAILGREAGRSAWALFVLTSPRSLWLLAFPKHEERRQGHPLWVVAWQWRGRQTWGHKRSSGKESNCSSGVSLGTHHGNMLQINIVCLTRLWFLHHVGRTTSPVTF